MSMPADARSHQPVMLLHFEGLRGAAALAVFAYHLHHVPGLAPLTERVPGFFGNG